MISIPGVARGGGGGYTTRIKYPIGKRNHEVKVNEQLILCVLKTHVLNKFISLMKILILQEVMILMILPEVMTLMILQKVMTLMILHFLQTRQSMNFYLFFLPNLPCMPYAKSAMYALNIICHVCPKYYLRCMPNI